METENNIIEIESGYKLINGNAQSIETYKSYADAEEASQADIAAWKNAEDAAEAEDNSPVEWE